ncbi:hypothetical protein [Staphylococcus capitis]|uniref:hypothetical protein n=1 Tax=Staphylococcus capitis TaxID=29388 RepID=UPI00119F4866|nr:hypothetical protein [Staphylococcus capitis]
MLFNDAEEGELGNVRFGNVFGRDGLRISVWSEGGSGKLGEGIINDLEDRYNEEYVSYVEFVYESRE